jgi:1,4-dihydroxy-2-naphthoate octaprenyltransferase
LSNGQTANQPNATNLKIESWRRGLTAVGRAASCGLIRQREWWFHKLPFCILVFALVSDGALTSSVLLRLVALIAIVSCVANYGNAVNEVCDVGEDARAGKPNIAAQRGIGAVWTIAAISAGLALAIACAVCARAVLLTICVLALAAAYSIPPVRLKAKMWLGVIADALCAHTYPALLTLALAVNDLPSWRHGALIAATVAWSFVAGLRNILSHQLFTERRDRESGLRTLVHRLGRKRTTRFLTALIMPLEVAALGAMSLLAPAGPIFFGVAALYVFSELLRQWSGHKHIFPFFDNAFYLSWGPLGALADLALRDLAYGLLLPAYTLLFWSNFAWAWRKAAEPIRKWFRPADREAHLRGLGADILLVRKSELFDSEWYSLAYPDVPISGMDAAEHYCRIGWREARDPSRNFSTKAYLTRNPDVAAAKINPFVHYLRYGRSEGR